MKLITLLLLIIIVFNLINWLVFMIKLIKLITKNNKIQNFIVKKPLIIYTQSHLRAVITSLSDFGGERIPIVNKKTNEMIGIISENDVLLAYLEISEEINQIEKHWFFEKWLNINLIIP